MNVGITRNLTTRLVGNTQMWGLLAVASLAIATVFTTGFLQNSTVHEVFHDLRHAMGLPCH